MNNSVSSFTNSKHTFSRNDRSFELFDVHQTDNFPNLAQFEDNSFSNESLFEENEYQLPPFTPGEQLSIVDRLVLADKLPETLSISRLTQQNNLPNFKEFLKTLRMHVKSIHESKINEAFEIVSSAPQAIKLRIKSIFYKEVVSVGIEFPELIASLASACTGFFKLACILSEKYLTQEIKAVPGQIHTKFYWLSASGDNELLAEFTGCLNNSWRECVGYSLLKAFNPRIPVILSQHQFYQKATLPLECMLSLLQVSSDISLQQLVLRVHEGQPSRQQLENVVYNAETANWRLVFDPNIFGNFELGHKFDCPISGTRTLEDLIQRQIQQTVSTKSHLLKDSEKVCLYLDNQKSLLSFENHKRDNWKIRKGDLTSMMTAIPYVEKGELIVSHLSLSELEVPFISEEEFNLKDGQEIGGDGRDIEIEHDLSTGSNSSGTKNCLFSSLDGADSQADPIAIEIKSIKIPQISEHLQTEPISSPYKELDCFLNEIKNVKYEDILFLRNDLLKLKLNPLLKSMNLDDLLKNSKTAHKELSIFKLVAFFVKLLPLEICRKKFVQSYSFRNYEKNGLFSCKMSFLIVGQTDQKKGFIEHKNPNLVFFEARVNLLKNVFNQAKTLKEVVKLILHEIRNKKDEMMNTRVFGEIHFIRAIAGDRARNLRRIQHDMTSLLAKAN